jgi:hypothetical protein
MGTVLPTPQFDQFAYLHEPMLLGSTESPKRLGISSALKQRHGRAWQAMPCSKVDKS